MGVYEVFFSIKNDPSKSSYCVEIENDNLSFYKRLNERETSPYALQLCVYKSLLKNNFTNINDVGDIHLSQIIIDECIPNDEWE